MIRESLLVPAGPPASTLAFAIIFVGAGFTANAVIVNIVAASALALLPRPDGFLLRQTGPGHALTQRPIRVVQPAP